MKIKKIRRGKLETRQAKEELSVEDDTPSASETRRCGASIPTLPHSALRLSRSMRIVPSTTLDSCGCFEQACLHSLSPKTW